jgi:hypothetical protein
MKKRPRPIVVAELTLDVGVLADALAARLRSEKPPPDEFAGRSWLLGEWAKLRGISKSAARQEIASGRASCKTAPAREIIRSEG